MFVVARMEIALLDKCTEWKEVVICVSCNIQSSKLHRMVRISDKVAYIGRIIVSLLAFESFMNRIF